MADSQNTESTADGGAGKVRSSAVPVPEQRWCRGEQWAVEGHGCARSLCGGADLVLSDLGESLMYNAPLSAVMGGRSG